MMDFLNAFCQVFICFFRSESPEYFNKIDFLTEPSKINRWASFKKLQKPLIKSNKGLNSALYSGSFLWNSHLKLKRQMHK